MTRRNKRPSETTLTIGPATVVGLGVLLLSAAAVMWLWPPTEWFGARGEVAAPTAGSQAAVTPGAIVDEPRLGSPDAPITVVEYGDFQCPNCRQFAVEVLPWLRETWIAEGMVQVIYRDFAIRGEESKLAAEAAHCAGEQGSYWPYHDRLFEAQAGEESGAFTRDRLLVVAADLGLDTSAFAECLTSHRYRARVDATTQSALDQGFEGTPTYVINGRTTAGAIEVDRWNELFAAYRRELSGGGGS